MSGFVLEIAVPRAALSLFESALEALGASLEGPGLENGVALVGPAPEAPDPVTLQLYCEEAPGAAAVTAHLAPAALAAGLDLPDWRLEALPEIDWVAESQRGLPPVRAGRFYLHGSHVTEPPPAGAIALLLDANAAFGTGRHESTFGCLEAACRLARARRYLNILDMGCGSGVLAMAAARLWKSPVLAVDNDPMAVAVARDNCRLNAVGPLVRCRTGDGYRTPEVAQRGPFDLVFANILADPLTAMAPDLARHLAPGGHAILAGLLTSQRRPLLTRHRAFGLHLLEAKEYGEWSTLVLGKR